MEMNDMPAWVLIIWFVGANVATTTHEFVSKEKSETWRGLGADRQKLQMIQLIIDLHNLEIIKKDETQNNKSSGESTPNSDVYKG
jgi:hypothetical protein